VLVITLSVAEFIISAISIFRLSRNKTGLAGGWLVLLMQLLIAGFKKLVLANFKYLEK